jgi:hypothetical protein
MLNQPKKKGKNLNLLACNDSLSIEIDKLSAPIYTQEYENAVKSKEP